MSIPLVICGAFGRMGCLIRHLVENDAQFFIAASVVRSLSKNEVLLSDTPLFGTLEEALGDIRHDLKDVVILDFSVAHLAKEHVKIASDFGAKILVGTTGHSATDLLHIKEFSTKIPILIAPNTSLMAHLLISFSKVAAASLKNFEASIVDIHHREKKDAPSGTALMLKNAISNIEDADIQSLRKGKVIGEHIVYFFNDFERLELTHRVADRRVFAEGALFAAQFLFSKGPGLYDMNDVLNLN